MMSREQLHHLSGAYVLNALDEDERRAFEACLAEWDDMRSEVTELADTAAALGLALPPVDPRPGVRQELLARVDATAQLEPAGPQPARRVRTLRRLARPSILWLAAAALLVVLAVSTALVPGAGSGEVTFARIAAAGDARSVPVTLEGSNGVELIWSDELNASALRWESLPPLEDGTVYELWYLDDVPRPAGIVTAAASGTQALEGTMQRGDRVAMTIEPVGGSAQPTAPPLVVIDPA